METLHQLSLIDDKSFNQIYELDEAQVQTHINNIVEVIKAVADKSDKLILITGSNGIGKSLLRQQIALALNEKKIKSSGWSMQKRTENNPEWGALSSALNDTSWIATSSNSLHGINSLFKSCPENFLIIDEPEIGMSNAMAKAIANKLVDFYKESSNGMMIISHNRHVVKRVLAEENAVFVNLNGLSPEEYVASFDSDEPFDLEKFKEFHLLFDALRDRMK